MSAPTATTRDWQGTTIPTPGTFAIDPAHTRVGFVARHLMVTRVHGGFPGVSGEITIAADPSDSSVAATIETATIETGSPDRDAHLRSGDFLDVERYPALTFTSKRLVDLTDSSFTLVGDLTIKDVTREVALRVDFDGVAVSPWGKEVVAFSARTEIDREDFGLTWNVALAAGGVLVSKKVTIEIEAQAVRQG